VNLRDALAVLETYVTPGQDLPEELFLFISGVTPLVNVDLLIKDEQNRTLLTWRDDVWYGAGWHIPGGVIRYKEHAQQRIHKVAEQELGCSVTADAVPIVIVESFSPHRERGHFVSLLYRCRLTSSPAASLEARATPQRGQWRWHSEAPPDLLAVQQSYTQFFS
jgi:colanic acid biosynthesis protein WcaH